MVSRRKSDDAAQSRCYLILHLNGSEKIETAFAEVAYYRLKFLNDTSAELGYLDISMTAFTAFLKTSCGIDLTVKPFNQFIPQISAKNDYQYSQALGFSMREAGVKAFRFLSARTPVQEKNVAAFSADVFYQHKNLYINNQQAWFCMANKEVVEFSRIGMTGEKRMIFPKSAFY